MEACGFWSMRLGFRFLDKRGISFDKFRTNKTSVQGYVKTYSGPVYSMHFKYASLMNITFITFLYGFGIPILFPISAFAIFVLFLVEKTMLFYAYQMPPMYDEKLSKEVLNKMNWAPIFYCAFAFWMAGNRQMDSNDNLVPRAFKSEAPLTTHVADMQLVEESWYNAPEWPLFVLFWFFLVNQLFGERIMSCFKRCCPGLKIGDVELNEDIARYYEALDPKDKEWTIKEEENARENLGMQILTKAQLTDLKGSKTSPNGRYLQGAHSYDILANPLYFDDFQYVPASIPDREKYIIDDDDDEDNDA